MLVCCEAAFCGMLVVCFFGNSLWDKSFWFAWVLLAFAIAVQTTKTQKQLCTSHANFMNSDAIENLLLQGNIGVSLNSASHRLPDQY